MHAAGDRAKGRLAIDIRAEAPGDGTTFISRVGIRSTETTPGCASARRAVARAMTCGFSKSSDIVRPGDYESASDAPARSGEHGS
jgi:hypothetical protein